MNDTDYFNKYGESHLLTNNSYMAGNGDFTCEKQDMSASALCNDIFPSNYMNCHYKSFPGDSLIDRCFCLLGFELTWGGFC